MKEHYDLKMGSIHVSANIRPPYVNKAEGCRYSVDYIATTFLPGHGDLTVKDTITLTHFFPEDSEIEPAIRRSVHKAFAVVQQGEKRKDRRSKPSKLE